ncbi:MAG: NAD(P)H-quinone oxidoreductase [Hyphomicrobiales bacterium]|nr:NAD(P)H-quinone oxidoreductase [Hyphomicrobiales bacterium]
MTLPQEMTAIEITEPGGPDVLQATTIPVPEPDTNEVLIKVAAAGVNRPDVIQRKGLYPPPPGASPIPGLEVAGTIVAKGPETSRYSIGDQVTALVTGGGYAQYCVANARAALPFPQRFDPVLAAALPETYFTVWHNLFFRGGLMSGETLLVHGGASGIGTTAIQIAKAFGVTVFTTAGSAEKCDFCEKLGADLAINYKEDDFVAAIKDKTGGKGVNFITDMVGGDYIQRNLDCIAEDGRIHQIAFLRGAKANVDFTRLMIKRITLTGSTLRPRSIAVKAQLARALEDQVWPLLSNGSVRPVIETVFPLEKAADAHRLMEESRHIGKILLTV